MDVWQTTGRTYKFTILEVGNNGFCRSAKESIVSIVIATTRKDSREFVPTQALTEVRADQRRIMIPRGDLGASSGEELTHLRPALQPKGACGLAHFERREGVLRGVEGSLGEDVSAFEN